MSNICDNQNNFNVAFSKALKYEREKNMPSPTAFVVTSVVAIAILIVLLIWALGLARKTKGDKLLHTFFALVASPGYIISYYISK